MSVHPGHHAANTHHGGRIEDEVEAEYDRLRGLARKEARKRGACFDEVPPFLASSHHTPSWLASSNFAQLTSSPSSLPTAPRLKSKAAYSQQNHAAAKEKSEQGKRHAAQMKEYDRQASEYIFRENNAFGRVDPDCIDLHGQFVEEAEGLLETRISADRAAGQSHLHAIIGKGHHSADHVQKLGPCVERLCDRLGLRYKVEENAGRVYIDLTGSGGPGMPHEPHVPHGPEEEGGGPQHGRPHRPPHRPYRPSQPPESRPDDTVGAFFAKLEKICCVVM